MHAPVHPLDPNFLTMVTEREHYIYADDYENVKARVDAEDYWYFSRWRWRAKPNKTGKLYMVRSTNDGDRKNAPSFMIYLHVAIFNRMGVVRPSGHTLTDHGDGNSLNCRRYNLSAATPSMNRRNLWGQGSLKW